MIVVKLAMMAVIAWLAVSNVSALLDWRSEPVANEPTSDTPAFPAMPIESAQMLDALSDGDWEFAGIPWRVRMAMISGDNIKQELAAWPKKLPTDEQRIDAESSQPLVAMLRLRGATEERLGSLRRLELEADGSHVVLMTQETAAGETILLGRMAWPEASDQWKLIEGSPQTSQSSEATTKKSAQNAAPPFPADATLMGTRRSRDGEVLGQLASCAMSRDQLAAFWKQAGWRVAALPVPAGQTELGQLEQGQATVSPESLPLMLDRSAVSYVATITSAAESQSLVLLTRVVQ